MGLYRKKEVVIEAQQFDSTKSESLAEWCGARIGREGSFPCLYIQSLEGEMRADAGDWIIKGVKGEFYPCKPDIFLATYEPA